MTGGPVERRSTGSSSGEGGALTESQESTFRAKRTAGYLRSEN